MTPADRDLLAAAARAAGKSRSEWDYDWLVERGVDVSRDMLWNPLENSGQALELAVMKDLDIVNYGGCVFVGDQRLDIWHASEDIGTDQLAATRRCITRAAGRIVPA